MDRHLQNAYSRQASVEVEQQIGERATLSAGYQYMRGLDLLMSINQNVPTCVAAGTNNGCRPNPDYANNSQYSVGRRARTITDCTSRSCSGRRDGGTIACRTRSRSR